MKPTHQHPEPDHRLLLWNLTVKLRRMLRHGEPDFLDELNAACEALGLEKVEPEPSHREG